MEFIFYFIEKMSKQLQIISKEAWFNTILFVALAPDEVDRNWDLITETEITKTAYEFMQNLWEKVVDVDHNPDDVVETAKFVESYIAPVDIELENWNVIPKWAWIVWIQFDDETYKKYLEWEYVWISIYGTWFYED